METYNGGSGLRCRKAGAACGPFFERLWSCSFFLETRFCWLGLSGLLCLSFSFPNESLVALGIQMVGPATATNRLVTNITASPRIIICLLLGFPGLGGMAEASFHVSA